VTLPVGSSAVQITARLVLANGRLGPPRTVRVQRATLRRAAGVDAAALAPGLAYAYYERSVRRATALAEWVPTSRGTTTLIGLTGTERAEQFGVRLTGFLRVPADAVYEFALLSDDGSVLRIAGETVVDHDGPHSAREKTGAIALAAGLHPIDVSYFQGEGDRVLELRIRRSGEAWGAVPREWLFRQR
jgi:hexosaminidase